MPLAARGPCPARSVRIDKAIGAVLILRQARRPRLPPFHREESELIKRLLRFIVVSAFTVSAVSALSAAPKIQFEQELVDFGKVSVGKPITVSFAFTNVGDSDLEILKISSGCGCTKAEANQTRVAPGQSSTIEAIFNSTGFNGRIHKSISISTNDPARPTLGLSISGEVESLARFRPERLNFGSMKVNTTKTHLLQVIPIDPSTFEITKVTVQGTHLAVPSFRKIVGESGDFWELSVVVSAGSNPTRVMESVNVLTNAGEKVKLNTTVYGNVVQ